MVRSNDSTGNLTFCDLWPSEVWRFGPWVFHKNPGSGSSNGLVGWPKYHKKSPNASVSLEARSFGLARFSIQGLCFFLRFLCWFFPAKILEGSGLFKGLSNNPQRPGTGGKTLSLASRSRFLMGERINQTTCFAQQVSPFLSWGRG